MELRNQVEWALHCCAVLSGLEGDQKISTKALAEFHGVPKEYLSKALQALAQAGLVVGTLGPTGGYRLALAPSEITFLDVVEAIEGKKRTFRCEEIRGNNPCIKTKAQKPKGICAVARTMYKADEAWRNQLRSVTLEELRKEVRKDVGDENLKIGLEWLLDR